MRTDAAPSAVAPEEPLARFLCSSSLFSRASGRVKYSAFLPRDGATSVFRVEGLGDSKIWDIGRCLVAGPSKRALHGRAELRVAHVESCGLLLLADDDPQRHAEIAGWPEEKGAQRFAAERLAGSSILRLLAPA